MLVSILGISRQDSTWDNYQGKALHRYDLNGHAMTICNGFDSIYG